VKRRHLIALPVAVAALVPACGGDDSDGRAVHVFAAASLKGAFTDIAAAFETEHADVDIVTNFAGSSALVTQIVEGAPTDVFASADMANMGRLTEAGGVAGEPVVFATNRAELVVAAGNPRGIEGLAALRDSALVLVTCAPVVPCGAYAADVFARAGVAVQPDSLEENVGAVLTKVVSGEADAGIVYTTDVLAAGDAVTGVTIPPEHNVVAEYPIAVTSAADHPDVARAFVDFATGPEGRAILAAYGFGAP
jgi:molybdate transport system substrate-binding protein